MKICALLPISMPKAAFGNYYDLLMRSYEFVKDGDTKVEIRDVPDGIKDPALMSFEGFRGLNEREIVRAMLKAEGDGFDGVSGACYFDCGVRIGSNLLTIPVLGAAESTMHLAGLMGRKFAVVTSEPVWVPFMTEYLIRMGFASFSVSRRPVRAMTMPLENMIEGLLGGKYGEIIANFLETARECLADGAEVIIAGCGLISPIFPVEGVGELEGAPVLDPMAMTLKMTETLVKLRMNGMQVKSRKGMSLGVPDEFMKKGLAELNLS